tara:strand:+ start:8483 stop:8758 length:276 start_codon:yes stop_codon:yes gene_type:complete
MSIHHTDRGLAPPAPASPIVQRLLNAPLTPSGHARLAWVASASDLTNSELWQLMEHLYVVMQRSLNKNDGEGFDVHSRRHDFVVEMIKERI